MHKHRFERYVGIEIIGRRCIAWVPKRAVRKVPSFRAASVADFPERWQCHCGEQGYEVPA